MTVTSTAASPRRGVLCTPGVRVPKPQATLAVRPSVFVTHPPVLLGRPESATQVRVTGQHDETGSDMLVRPQEGDRDMAALARVIIGAVATSGGWRDEHDVADRYLDLAVAKKAPFSKHAAPDRLVKVAAGFASTYTYTWWPDGWTWAGDDLAASLSTMSELEQLGQAHVGRRSPRLAWWSPNRQLILDELTPVDLSGLLLDDWMRPRVAADLAAGLHLAGNKFLGVRVMSPRLRRTGLLITPDGEVQELRTSALGQIGRDL